MDNIIVWVVIIAIVLWVINKRNEFEATSQKIDQSSSNISGKDEQLQQYLENALSQICLSTDTELEAYDKMSSKEKYDSLVALAQANRFPTMQSLELYKESMAEARSIIQDISGERRLMNGNINEYNTQIASFPGLIVAKIFGYKRRDLYDQENMHNNLRRSHTNFDYKQYQRR